VENADKGSLAAEAAARVQAIVAAAERQADERAAAAARRLLERIDAVRSELEALRAGAASLSGSLDDLRDEVAALGGRAAEPEPPAPVESAPAPNGARSADEAGARLVALNMALEGSPRDATARYLAEQFELPDLDALLDDVYASAGK
jgi:polyhydroxyalkanoate synthesis regulator phasin